MVKQQFPKELDNKEFILQMLDANIHQIKHLLKQNRKKKNAVSHKTPWFLLLGPNGSDKEELIEQSQTVITHTLSQEQQEYKTWITKNGIIVNIPDPIITRTKDINTWQNIVALFKQNRPKKPFDGIILVLNLKQAIQQPKHARYILTKKLHDILSIIGKKLSHSIPLYLVFSHLESTQGFYDYFGDISDEERSELIGFNFPTTSDPSLLKNYLKYSYKNLLKRLHSRLIWRLQYSSSFDKIPLIYEFPVQFETNKKYLFPLVENLFTTKTLKKIKLMGMYFTSHNQAHSPIDALSHHNKDVLDVKPYVTHPVSSQNVHFASKLFNDVIVSDHALSTKNENYPAKNMRWFHQVFFAFISTLIIIISFNLTKVFTYDKTLIAEINGNLLQAQIHLNNLSFDKTEPRHLIKLLQTSNHAKKKIHSLSWLQSLVSRFSNIEQIRSDLDQFTFSVSNKILLPSMHQQLHNQLQQAITKKDLPKIYKNLNAYIMLNNKHYYSHRELSKTIIDAYKYDPFFSNDDIKELTPHIRNFLIHPPTVVLDNALIIKAQQILNSHSISELVLLILAEKQPQALLKNLSPSVLPSKIIPPIYLRENFFAYYDQTIPQLCQNILKSSWLISKEKDLDHFDDLKRIIDICRKKYMQSYISWWQNYVSQLLPNNKLYNHKDITTSFSFLNKNRHLLQQALANIHKNTAPFQQTNLSSIDFNLTIAQAFSSFNQKANKNFAVFEKTLLALYKQHQILEKHSYSPTQVFLFVQDVFKTSHDSDELIKKLKNSDDVLSQWLYDFAINMWDLKIKIAQEHIENVWKNEIVANYLLPIEKLFPFNKNAKKELSLAKFITIFGHNGVLSKFFTEYVEPFFDTEVTMWQTKSIYGKSLAFADEVKEHFIKLQLIQKMFFSKNKLELVFNLQPVHVQPIVKKVSLSIDDQNLVVTHKKKDGKTFKWPNNNLNMVAISFESIDGKKTSHIESGQWALFKLMEKGNLKQLRTNEFQLLFNLAGNAATFKLIPQSRINPFVSGIIEKYNVPKTFFVKTTIPAIT